MMGYRIIDNVAGFVMVGEARIGIFDLQMRVLADEFQAGIAPMVVTPCLARSATARMIGDLAAMAPQRR